MDAGFDGIEHGGFLTNRTGAQTYVPEIAEKVARAGIPVTSTLAVGALMLKSLRAIEHPTPADRALLDRWVRMGEQNLSQFSRMREAGVTWLAGTDAGWRFTTFDCLPPGAGTDAAGWLLRAGGDHLGHRPGCACAGDRGRDSARFSPASSRISSSSRATRWMIWRAWAMSAW